MTDQITFTGTIELSISVPALDLLSWAPERRRRFLDACATLQEIGGSAGEKPRRMAKGATLAAIHAAFDALLPGDNGLRVEWIVERTKDVRLSGSTVRRALQGNPADFTQRKGVWSRRADWCPGVEDANV